VYAWGLCVLTHLYHDMHFMVYRKGASLGCGFTLPHVWTWEHIVMTRLVCAYARPVGQPFVFAYT